VARSFSGEFAGRRLNLGLRYRKAALPRFVTFCCPLHLILSYCIFKLHCHPMMTL
jgi:hypothetical protein